MSIKVFDADVLVPENEEIHVGGRVFSIGKIPMRISIKIYENMAKKDMSTGDTIKNMSSVVTSVLQLADPKLKEDWVLENVDVRQLSPLFTEICEMMSRVNENK